MQPVLIVGTDFSETALHAVREARRLAMALDGAVEVVHVREGLRRDPLAADEGQLAWLDAAGVAIDRLEVLWGTPWVEIVRRARDLDADLVVAGTHGTTGFQSMALGSTAQRLALLSPRPVVLVGPREAPNHERPRPTFQPDAVTSAGPSPAGG